MKEFGVIGINVNRVTRIHNRFLRNRFEDKLEQLVDLSDNAYKRSLEYLFYGINPDSPKELYRAIEEGFKSVSEYEEMGMPSYITLVNSIASAELPRIHSLDKTLNGRVENITSGKIVVCKIFLQKSTHDTMNPHFNPCLSATETWRTQPLNV